MTTAVKAPPIDFEGSNAPLSQAVNAGGDHHMIIPPSGRTALKAPPDTGAGAGGGTSSTPIFG